MPKVYQQKREEEEGEKKGGGQRGNDDHCPKGGREGGELLIRKTRLLISVAAAPNSKRGKKHFWASPVWRKLCPSSLPYDQGRNKVCRTLFSLIWIVFEFIMAGRCAALIGEKNIRLLLRNEKVFSRFGKKGESQRQVEGTPFFGLHRSRKARTNERRWIMAEVGSEVGGGIARRHHTPDFGEGLLPSFPHPEALPILHFSNYHLSPVSLASFYSS